MVVAAIDQRDVRRRVLEFPSGGESSKPAAHNHNVGSVRSR